VIPTAPRAIALNDAAQDVRPVAMAVLDRELRIAAVSDQLPVLLGRPAESLVGQQAADVFTPVWDTLEGACRKVLTAREPGGPLRVNWPRGTASGPALWAIGLRPVREPDGSVSGVAIAVVDESEGRLLRDQLRQAQKMEALGRLAGGIAHDFNNMLTAIGGYTGLVHSDLAAGDPHREDLEEVLKAVDRARVMTLRLLTFVRRAPSRPQVESVDAVARDTVRLLRHLIGEDVRLHTLLRARSAVRMDTGELQQLLVNLAVNARDAMPSGGTLTLETQDVSLGKPIAEGIIGAPAGEYVQITVADTGTGIDPETQRRVFESFFTTKAPGAGTGLGLATALAAVERGRGDISLTSRVGSGTRVDIYLPRVEGVEATAATERPIPRGTETVLVAEDEAQVRSATVRMLDRLGYTVAGAASGYGALELFHAHPHPALLVTDIALPDMSGPELARRCAVLEPELKVLFVSGFSSCAAADPLLTKPFDQQALGLGVRDVLDG
jgi:two-component system cell cycle sensor histidine kinase/response regulator CckA